MKTDAVRAKNVLGMVKQPVALDALADARKSEPPPEVRRTILRRLTLRLKDEGLFGDKRKLKGYFKQAHCVRNMTITLHIKSKDPHEYH